jgi:hypothetical protein
MHSNLCKGLFAIALIGATSPAFANVITDWDEKALVAVTPLASLGNPSPYMAQRMMAMVHAAMFDTVNSIEHRYRPYLAQLPADPAPSKEAAAAAAAAAVLGTIDTKTAGEMKVALAAYLAPIPDGTTKADGIKLGEAVAARVLEARRDDGSDAPDDYRPRTTPGVYVPTTITISSMWPRMKPFVMASPSQFRPQPPVSLTSQEWATDYNELKDYGGQISAKRTAEQTETARFWLVGPPVAYHPFLRKLVTAKQMDVVDSARLMALASVGLTDAIIAVLDAKYHYNFWRPITAIRNGDMDGNPDTDREATWQPIATTPMHPEYPCAHCIQRQRRGSGQGGARNRGHPRDPPDQPDGAWCHPPLDQHDGLHGRDRQCSDLGRFPLPVLDPRRDGDGTSDRRIRCEERDAARGYCGPALTNAERRARTTEPGGRQA